MQPQQGVLQGQNRTKDMVLFEFGAVNLGVSGILATDVERVNVVKCSLKIVAFVAKTVVKQAFEGRNLRLVQPQPVALDFHCMQSHDFVFGFRFRGKLSNRFLGHNNLVSLVNELVNAGRSREW
jgi:hypothetical protein